MMMLTGALTAVLGFIPAARAQDANTTPTSQGQGSSSHKSGGLWSKLAANAKYQQAKQNGATPEELEAIKNGTDSGASSQSNPNHPYDSKSKPLCKMSDPGVHLVNGNWAGLNCITVDADGKPVNPEDLRKTGPQGDQKKRASDIESHSCMTTEGADKANSLAADCEKVTSGSNKGCNIQQNTCDEIREATRKGCNGLAAEGPDWCLTRYN